MLKYSYLNCEQNKNLFRYISIKCVKMNDEKVSRKHSFQLVGQASSRSNDIILLVLIPLTTIAFIIMALFNAASSTGFISNFKY